MGLKSGCLTSKSPGRQPPRRKRHELTEFRSARAKAGTIVRNSGENASTQHAGMARKRYAGRAEHLVALRRLTRSEAFPSRSRDSLQRLQRPDRVGQVSRPRL